MLINNRENKMTRRTKWLENQGLIEITGQKEEGAAWHESIRNSSRETLLSSKVVPSTSFENTFPKFSYASDLNMQVI